jgi:hypothetical protein
VPHFTLQISPEGPLINAVIGVSEARKAALTEASQNIPNLVPIRALIDTGATSTCLDPSILHLLNLTPKGKIPVQTPTTGGIAVEADQYDVSIIIPAFANQTPLILSNLPVICMPLVASMGPNVQALIGRDILAQCVLGYNGSAELFTLAY